jgi:histidinol dehydrogenase
MLKIFDVNEARNSILRRTPLNLVEYPPPVIASVEKIFGDGATPNSAVAEILTSIQKDGDAAVRGWSKILDQFDQEDFRVPRAAIAAAAKNLDPELVQALKFAANRIRDFHARQPLPDWKTTEMGGVVGQRGSPIEKVGVYVPGGTAPLPSSLLMSVIPAQVAGVKKIVVCTPPNPHPSILAAAQICGIGEIYQIGGAQAIGAMAFGTETVSQVYKIVGAGNLFVTLAKKQVYGIVGLDGLFGPTETMVIADETANPAWVAADLLAQAEHDVLASAILLTTSQVLADAVQVEVCRQMEHFTRDQVLEQSLANQSGIVIVPDMAVAAELANDYGAEHLCLSVAAPDNLAATINNAGGFFLGDHSFEVLGDYVAGPSHIMPTSGTARFASPLNVLDFVKINSIVALDPKTAAELSPIAAKIARAESLTAHAAAADFRTGITTQD